MFTGLVQNIGVVKSADSGPDGTRLHIETNLGEEIEPGDSVAVDGVCLTAISAAPAGFEVEAMKQTLSVTASAMLAPGDRVNLELAMRPTDRLGGHIVQGHVDSVGEVVDVRDDGFAKRIRVRLEPSAMRLMVPRGSITLDGVSLTVAEMSDDWVGVSLIPETLSRTTLGGVQEGRKLNVECDLIAKHVERLMGPLVRKEQA